MAYYTVLQRTEKRRKLLDIGFYISFSGIVTFRNAEQLRDAARYVPRIDYWWKLTHLTLRRYRIEEKRINLRWFVTLQNTWLC